MKKKAIVCVFLALIFRLTPAQEYQLLYDDISVALNDVEVNGNRNKLYSELGRILIVVDKSEIAMTAVKSIDELLNLVGGIDVRHRGNNGIQADISIRGGSFDQVLVLLNGINITDPQTGHYTMDIPLDIADVERVEVLQGSSARVLGPNAFSGAINIVTTEKKQHELNLQMNIGSFGYLSENLTGALSFERFNGFISVSHKKSDGYRENTDFSRLNIYWVNSLKTKEAGSFDAQFSIQQKSFGANGFYSLAYPNQFEHTKTGLASLSWHLSRNRWRHSAKAYWRRHDDRFELFRAAENAPEWYSGHNYHQTDVSGGSLSTTYAAAWGKATLGYDWRNEHIYSNTLGDEMNVPRPVPFDKEARFTKETNRLLSNFFVDYAKNVERWYLSGGGALSFSSDFGSHLYGGVDIAYHFTDEWRVFTSANTAVRLPTFTDLYYQSATQTANPDLNPEKSITVELGTELSQNSWKINATAFYRIGSAIIDWVKEPDAVKWESRNLTNVNALGGDCSFQYRLDSRFINRISGAYSVVYSDKSAENFDSKYALDYLRHKVILGAGHPLWAQLVLSWNLSLFDRSGNYSDINSGATTDYTPYCLLDARLLWQTKWLNLFVDANNVFNTEYADYGGLPQPKFNLNTGVVIKIK
ncbi:MAG: TonB-dependent receptor [Prevotellaceae bacterium]|jgi:iron complex outermembrane receptor protein|nr:TonB-dependent receptor [Prevotellaceae bacterium]